MSYNFADFERFARKLKLDSGKPLKLEEFQKEILRDHFGPARQLTVIIPKKNYKTTTLAAVALFHLHETNQADVPILAASSKQSGIMFRQAANFVRNSGTKVKGTGWKQSDLKDVYDVDGVTYEVRTGFKEIRANGGLLYVVAADTDRLDGVIPSLALVDELHRHRDGQNYGVLSDGLGPRKARLITISTAGAREDSPLGVLRAESHRYRNQKVDERHARYQEGSNVLHEWALLPTDDTEDMKTVKKANPAKTNNITELKRRRKDPMMTVGRWLRFACGIWTAGEEPEILAKDWDPFAADIGGLTTDDDVVMAPSVGHNAVIALAAVRPDGKVAVRCEHIEPVPGHSIQALTEDKIVELCDVYRVQKVLGPRYGLTRSMELVEARGVYVEDHPYSTPRQIEATGSFDRFLRSGNLIHDGDPTTRAHVLAAIKKTGAMGEHYLASDSTRAIVAISQAVHAVTAYNPDGDIVLPSEVM